LRIEPGSSTFNGNLATPDNDNMAAAVDSSAAEAPQSVVRKYKASDLPLPSATRSAIEGLSHTFKKKGRYDAIRKQLWASFEEKVRVVSDLLCFVAC